MRAEGITVRKADVKGFEDAYSKYAKLRKEGRLYPLDREPSPQDYGLIAWAAEQIKRRVNREVNRPV